MPEDTLQALHDHLEATGELPVESSASHYLGEAQAVVADASKPGTPDSVVRQRVEQAADLIGHVEETGDQRADAHVAAAEAYAQRVLESLDSPDA